MNVRRRRHLWRQQMRTRPRRPLHMMTVCPWPQNRLHRCLRLHRSLLLCLRMRRRPLSLLRLCLRLPLRLRRHQLSRHDHLVAALVPRHLPRKRPHLRLRPYLHLRLHLHPRWLWMSLLSPPPLPRCPLSCERPSFIAVPCKRRLSRRPLLLIHAGMWMWSTIPTPAASSL